METSRLAAFRFNFSCTNPWQLPLPIGLQPGYMSVFSTEGWIDTSRVLNGYPLALRTTPGSSWKSRGKSWVYPHPMTEIKDFYPKKKICLDCKLYTNKPKENSNQQANKQANLQNREREKEGRKEGRTEGRKEGRKRGEGREGERKKERRRKTDDRRKKKEKEERRKNLASKVLT